MERPIFHVDANSAALSWEATRRVSLGEEDIRVIPPAIGGNREKRTGKTVSVYLRKCPYLVYCQIGFSALREPLLLYKG